MPEGETESEPVQNPLTRDVRVRSQAAQRKHAAKDSAGPTGAPRPPAVSSTRLICMPCLRPFADDETYDANSSNDSDLSLSPQAQRIAANFVIMSLCFALNHAAVVTTLQLAAAELGPLGSYATGVLFTAYTLAALLFAPAVVQWLKPKRAMVLSCTLYTCYTASFWAGLLLLRTGQRTAAWGVVLCGSLLGGAGAGWLWTSQGQYFTETAQALAHVWQRRQSGADVADGGYMDDAFSTTSTGSISTSRTSGSDSTCAIEKTAASVAGNELDTPGAAHSDQELVVTRPRSKSAAVRRQKLLQEHATAKLSGAFGFWFLALELLVKLLVSALMGLESHGHHNTGAHPAAGAGAGPAQGAQGGSTTDNGALGLLQACAACSTIALQLFVWPSPSTPPPPSGVCFRRRCIAGAALSSPLVATPAAPARRPSLEKMIRRKCGRVRLAMELLARPDRRMVLLVPFQILFGAMSALLIVYVNGNIVKTDIGTDAIGYFTAILAGTAALCSPALASFHSKRSSMLAGCGAFAAEAVLLLSLPSSLLTSHSWAILTPLYTLHGVGRAVFESANKAVIADHFGDTGDSEAAFANVIVFSGASSALGLFVFPTLSATVMLALCIALATIAAAGIVVAQSRREKALEAKAAALDAADAAVTVTVTLAPAGVATSTSTRTDTDNGASVRKTASTSTARERASASASAGGAGTLRCAPPMKVKGTA